MIFRFFLASLALMALELALLIELVQEIGFLRVAGLLFLSAVLGVMLIRLEGFRLLVEARAAVVSGRLPERGIIDRILVFFGASLLIAPGVVSDLVALFLFIPWPRRWIARRIESAFKERVIVRHFYYGDETIDTEGEIIEGEIVQDDEAGRDPRSGQDGRPDRGDYPRLPPRG